MSHKFIFDTADMNSIFKLRDALFMELYPIAKAHRPIIFLCIGTDRSTGDSLGPLVGYKLKFFSRKGIDIYGNLDQPVHAKNITTAIENIKSTYDNPYIIAIDASLGNIQNVGKIILENRPVNPGAALNKDLPSIGDLSITGIVNMCGNLEFMILQNTRLNVVMQQAEIISQGIYHCLVKLFGGKKYSDSDISIEDSLTPISKDLAKG